MYKFHSRSWSYWDQTPIYYWSTEQQVHTTWHGNYSDSGRWQSEAAHCHVPKTSRWICQYHHCTYLATQCRHHWILWLNNHGRAREQLQKITSEVLCNRIIGQTMLLGCTRLIRCINSQHRIPYNVDYLNFTSKSSKSVEVFSIRLLSETGKREAPLLNNNWGALRKTNL